MAATLDDIAKETGLSRATVARAIGKYGYVSKKAREKVIAAAKKLNYKPNYIAKSMATGETKNIGLIVGDIQNPFFSTIARAISDVIVPEGYSLIVTSTDEKVEVRFPEEEARTVELADATHMILAAFMEDPDGGEEMVRSYVEDAIDYHEENVGDWDA